MVVVLLYVTIFKSLRSTSI